MSDQSPLITILRWIGKPLPGDWLKTFVYLNFIEKPRRYLRLALHSFYRMDHIYAVIREFRAGYRGRFSILEFGVADGYAFTKKLYATRYLKMEDRIVVHGFDTFQGMPDSDDSSDRDIVSGDGWVEGQFKGDYERLEAHCREKYTNYRLHKGLFEDSLTDELLEELKATPPMLVWIDCDYYSSTRVVFERLLPLLPTGCVIYFDDMDFNYGSRFTGEARIVHEINQGVFGEGLELIRDDELSLNLNRVYRFINTGAAYQYEPVQRRNTPQGLRRRGDDSPLP